MTLITHHRLVATTMMITTITMNEEVNKPDATHSTPTSPLQTHHHNDPPSDAAFIDCELVRVGSSTDPSIVQQAADLLARQWPRGGSPERYRDRYFAVAADESTNQCASDSLTRLPCSYLLIDSNSHVLAHGRLTECHDDSGAGRAAAATFVVVDPAVRGRGIGRHLMKALEDEALRLDYQYLYLWTQTAIGFYETLGYKECHRVSLHRDCLKALQPEQVSDLENVLFKRFAAAADPRKKPSGNGEAAALATKNFSQPETILLPPDEGCDDRDVWMRKRLVEAMDPVCVSADERLEELRRYVRERTATASDNANLSWEYVLVPLPWHPQVGPSCGMAAVRMVSDPFRAPVSHKDDPPISLLQTAQNLGMTVDGELFDAEDLASLARTCCQLDRVHVRSFPSVEEFASITAVQGGLVMIPYDSHPKTRLPFLNSGRSAHWGVVVGLLLGIPGERDDSGEPSLTPWRDTDFNFSTAAEAILLVQHGLSRKLSIAPYEQFRSSNAQLSTVDSRKFHVRHLNLTGRAIVVTSDLKRT